MSKRKSATEIAEDIKRLEERLRQARENERRVTKAEEARDNAEILRAVREYHEALPQNERPAWRDMPEYIRGHIFSKPEESAAPDTEQMNYF